LIFSSPRSFFFWFLVCFLFLPLFFYNIMMIQCWPVAVHDGASVTVMIPSGRERALCARARKLARGGVITGTRFIAGPLPALGGASVPAAHAATATSAPGPCQPMMGAHGAPAATGAAGHVGASVHHAHASVHHAHRPCGLTPAHR
jgi:hypothetical protein